MPLDPSQRHPLMCLTHDSPEISHLEQAVHLLISGARWIQVRMKRRTVAERLHTAGMIASLCRQYDAVCIVNDDVDVAIAANAHGVHLGKKDLSWRAARERMGRDMILGGTVNNEEDARRALDANCLDYVGIGPWRFTTTKENLAPVLGGPGVAALVAQLDGLPAWAIGGVVASDLPDVRAAGAAGAAVTSALSNDGRIRDNFLNLDAAWREALKT